MMILKWIAFGMKRLVFVSFYRNSQTIRATRWIFRTMLGKKKRYVVYTYSLIVLIKLDFPAPAMPVIAMCTSTSLHPPISLLLKKYAMESGLRRPFFSTSFWKSCTYFDSQFIAIGWLETERYAACCERKWASTTTKPYCIEGYTWRNILDRRAFALRHHTQRKSFGLQSLLLRHTAENLQVT